MNARNWPKYLLLSAVLAVAVLVLGSTYAPGRGPGGNATVALLRPPFLGVAQAQEIAVTPPDFAATLDTEAGISAYFKAPNGITLSQVRGLFRTIETETVNYIIGSVAVAGYPDHFDVHVYVNKNGWVLTYYLREAPISKIIDINGRTIESTKLKNVLATFAAVAGTPLDSVGYYDFRYPNAANLLFVSQDYGGGNTFTILPPSSYAYSEASWAAYDDLWVDNIGNPNYQSPWGGNQYGPLTAAQLLPGVTHTIRVDNYGVLVIAYRVP